MSVVRLARVTFQGKMVSGTTSLNTWWLWVSPKFYVFSCLCSVMFFSDKLGYSQFKTQSLWTVIYRDWMPESLQCTAFFLQKSPCMYDTSKLKDPYLTEYSNVVQCKTRYHLEIEAETAVWYGSYAGYKRVQMTSRMIHYFWKMDH